jgi:hypothetical protein
LNKNERVSTAVPVLLLISTGRHPIALVPAASIAEAQERAIELIRDDNGRRLPGLMEEATVTIFSPALIAGGETIAYLPTHVGSSRGAGAITAGGTSKVPGTTH